MNEEKLKDVIAELFNGKYSRRYILEALAWGEQNTAIYWPLMIEHQPKYCNENGLFLFGCPINVFLLTRDIQYKIPV